MKKYEFKLVFLDRIELREDDSDALRTLHDLGEAGWHIVHVREDARKERSLAMFMERERPG